MKIGLIGNPNVGKSTIFNALTGMHQHTGNWPGKTVAKASGVKKYKGVSYIIEDLPGTYSLLAHSKEEEVTRDFVYSNDYDGLIIVCDATTLERNLNLVIQVLQITNKVVLCINLLDEAKKKKIEIDFKALEKLLNVPVVSAIARSSKGIDDIMESLTQVLKRENSYYYLKPPKKLQESVSLLEPLLASNILNKTNYALNLLTTKNVTDDINMKILKDIKKDLKNKDIKALITENVVNEASRIADKVITYHNKDYQKKDRIIDKIVTNKYFSIPIMLIMLLFVFWLTIVGTNYFSGILYDFLFSFEKPLLNFLEFCHLPAVIVDMFVYGLFRVLAWVIAVMLPPMAIFFPLFTLLEDLGYLPRIAFCLDKAFKKCASCGKQALTMAMGFGCNAVGVTGARIIDSPRERLMAILTNVFVPCNGRFPLIISMITMFLIVSNNNLLSALLLTLFIVLGVFVTFVITKILSKTLLKGVPSSFTLELPSYRRPQVGKVIVRSLFDRTIFVLKRAICASAPAGIVIWLMANVQIGSNSLLAICSGGLDPFARLIGLDGVILMAFILAFPANEIVIPIIIMGYMSLGYLTDIDNLTVLKDLFVQNGWTNLTAICTIIFSLMHWPCLTTVLTIKKETGSLKWTLLSIIIPTITGILLCFLTTLVYNLLF